MKQLILVSTAIAFVLVSCGQRQQETNTANEDNTAPAMSSGKTLFVNNCVICHSLNEDKTGPKLAGAIGRWNNDTAQMITYIKNSQQVISSGKNPYITKLYHKWNETIMPPFSNLTDADIKDILDYIGKGQE